METLSGRVVLTEGSSFTLPLLPRSYGTLIPGQTFPLTVSDYPRTHMLRKCVETDHTFGCVATRYNNVGIKDELIGTTAEIFEFSDEMGHVCIKAKGRQRFRVLKAKRNDAGYFIGDVKILPEVKLSKPLTQLQNKTLNRFRTSQKERCKKRDALLTPWPSWVYDQYDTDKLVERVDKELTFLKQGLRQVNGRITMPQEPTELSFWIATHLDPDERHFVIRLNSPIQRLRWQLSLMSKCHTYVCGSCGSEIGHQSDVFAMSVEGAQNTYVNPHGFQHETITLTNATSLAIVSPPSNQFSWFPGYAWSIAVCESCRAHIGWQFSAQQSRLRPSKFWGLSRQSLKTKLSKEGRQECDIPVM